MVPNFITIFSLPIREKWEKGKIWFLLFIS